MLVCVAGNQSGEVVLRQQPMPIRAGVTGVRGRPLVFPPEGDVAEGNAEGGFPEVRFFEFGLEPGCLMPALRDEIAEAGIDGVMVRLVLTGVQHDHAQWSVTKRVMGASTGQVDESG